VVNVVNISNAKNLLHVTSTDVLMTDWVLSVFFNYTFVSNHKSYISVLMVIMQVVKES